MAEFARTYPMPPLVHILRYVHTLLVRTIAVCGAWFLIVVCVGIGVENGSYGLDRELARGLDAYFRNWMLVGALLGIFATAVVLAVVHDLYRNAQRRALDEHARDPANTEADHPVEWQRVAIRDGNASMGLTVLGFFGVVLGPVIIITAIVMAFQDTETATILWLLAIGAAMTCIGSIPLVRMLEAPGPGPAQLLWGQDADQTRSQPGGTSSGGDERERTGTRRTRPEASGSPATRRLAALDRVVGHVLGASMWGFLGTGVLTMLAAFLRQPCRYCEQRYFSPPVEAFIDGVLALAAVLCIAALATLIASAAAGAVVHLRLRRTVLREAADPDAPAPPDSLLSTLLAEEAPLQTLAGHLHTIGITAVVFGLTGALTADAAPFYQWQAAFRALVTLGGVMLLLHASAWFWQRDRTLAENRALAERWPG